MKKIISNKIKCKNCGNIIESKTLNDYQKCLCGQVAVDGGLDYLKRTFKNDNDYEELSEIFDTDDKRKEKNNENRRKNCN